MSERIIISPLDWGLGHATRCVPIIRSYLDKGAEVEIASAISHKKFFAQEFPNLTWYEVPSYDIKYSRYGWQMPFCIFSQIPHIKKIMREENKWLASLCEKQKYTQIISDNRFGFFCKKIKSIYITHQLRIAFPGIFSAFEKIGEMWHKNIMNNFDEIWVPDYKEFSGLAGKLSHPSYTSEKIKYIGPLSRLTTKTMSYTPCPMPPKNIDILALISGPEPQRSSFEKYAIKFLTKNPGNHCIVRGLPNETETPNLPFQVFNHLPAENLREKILSSKTVLCRSGYSTLMDLDLLKANAILVPTPGQTEQVYLAKIWKRKIYQNIIRLDECESTHEFMRKNFAGLPEWSVVTAEHQTNGHGRHGRAWVAPKGKNLCFNILLPTKNLKPEFYAPTTQIAAITLANMLIQKGACASIKWPNDILVNKRKICGIISELLYEPNCPHPKISLGIGLNVNTENADFAGLDRPVTSMFIETGEIWDRDALLREFLNGFNANFELLCKNGLQTFIDEWKKMGCFVGHKAKIVEGESVLDGVIEAVQKDGSLLFRTEAGLKTIWSGDLEI